MHILGVFAALEDKYWHSMARFFSSLQVHMWYSARTHITTVSSDPSKEEWPCLVYCRWNLEGGLQEPTRILKSKSCLGLEYLDKKRSRKKATPTRLGSAAPPFTLSAVSCVGCFWWSAFEILWGGALLPSSLQALCSHLSHFASSVLWLYEKGLLRFYVCLFSLLSSRTWYFEFWKN